MGLSQSSSDKDQLGKSYCPSCKSFHLVLDNDSQHSKETIIQVIFAVIPVTNPPASKKECVICFNNSPDYIITVCGHKCLCEKCGKILTQCPICREDYNPLTEFIKVFEV